MADGVAGEAKKEGAARRLFERFSRPDQHPNSGPVQVWYDEASTIDQHMMDAVRHGLGANLQNGPLTNAKAPRTPIETYSDADMIMDMLRRGYAVMKLPADGGPPEVLRGQADSK